MRIHREKTNGCCQHLEQIKSIEDKECKVLAARIVELEGKIKERERQLLIDTTNNNNVGEQLAHEI